MANYEDKFFEVDPGNPPESGTSLTAKMLTITDANNNNYLSPPQWYQNPSQADQINGEQITRVWVGDTITYTDAATGATLNVTGVTFYTADNHQYFTPTDGSNLHDGVFQSSTYVTVSTGIPIGNLGTPCFVTGTLVRTPDGERRVEDLVPGDLVLTRDNGAQPLRWIGKTTVTGQGSLAPIRFAPGAIGNTRELLVSPQHRMLISGWQAELIHGQDEVLAAATHLVNGDTITRMPCRRVTYVHLLFDRHEILEAEGVPTESFHPGDYLMSRDADLRAEIVELFPELDDLETARGWDAARSVLKAHEARVMALAA